MIAVQWNVGSLQHLKNIVKDYIEKIATLEILKIVVGGFEPDDIFHKQLTLFIIVQVQVSVFSFL